MAGVYIARRYLNESGTIRPVDYHFDSLEKAQKFIENVKLTTPEDHGHDFEILSHQDDQILKQFEGEQ